MQGGCRTKTDLIAADAFVVADRWARQARSQADWGSMARRPRRRAEVAGDPRRSGGRKRRPAGLRAHAGAVVRHRGAPEAHQGCSGRGARRGRAAAARRTDGGGRASDRRPKRRPRRCGG